MRGVTPGRSFAPILRGDDIEWNNTVFFEYIDTRVIQTRNWKYIRRFLAAPDELYDLNRDPGETRNLADDPKLELVVQDLAEQLAVFFNQYADPRYDIWRGGTAKATLYYGGRNSRIAEHFPGWTPPITEKAVPFRDY